MNENRTVKISFRMSEAEVTKMEALMAMEGFRSRSLYLRKVAAGPRVFRRNLRHHDANIAKQIEILRAEIKRIGVNYNQVGRAVNTLAQLRDKRGNAVISAHTIDGNLTDLKNMMLSVLEKVNAISAEVSDNPNTINP